jgi:RNA polymerase sigma-70 factor (family 1)
MKSSFESVYNKNYSSFVRLARLYVGDLMDAEDIVQDVFMHMWIRLDINHDLSCSDFETVSYMVVSVKNKCLDFLRLKKRMNYICSYSFQDDFNTVSEPVEYYVPEEEKHLNEEDLEHKITAAIDNLPSKCRQIFIEKRIIGEKQINIAQRHKISVKTIEKQMTIAYKKLRLELSCLVTY